MISLRLTVKKRPPLVLAKKAQYLKWHLKHLLPPNIHQHFLMILSTMPKRPIRKIKASLFRPEDKMSRAHPSSERTKTQGLAITTLTQRKSWIAPIVDSRWPKTKGLSTKKRNQPPLQNQHLSRVQDTTQSSQLLAAIIKSSRRTKISTHARSLSCQRMSPADWKQSRKGKYVTINLFFIDNPQMTRTG